MKTVDGGPKGGIETGEERLATDVVFDLLASRRRRLTLQSLREGGGTMTIRELADWVAVREFGRESDQLTSRQQKLVYNSLQQTHLPRLAAYGLVEYDGSTGPVRLLKTPPEVYNRLRLGNERNERWLYLYATWGLLGVFLDVLISMGWFGDGPMVTVAVLAVVSTIVLATAAVQWYVQRTGSGRADEQTA